MENGGPAWCVMSPFGSVRLHQVRGRGGRGYLPRWLSGLNAAALAPRTGRQRTTGGTSAGAVQGTRRVLEQGGCAGSKECRLQHGRGAWVRPAFFSRREAPRQGPMTDADPASPRFKSANQALVVLGTAATGVAVFGIGFVE